jgi:hypothetical protein
LHNVVNDFEVSGKQPQPLVRVPSSFRGSDELWTASTNPAASQGLATFVGKVGWEQPARGSVVHELIAGNSKRIAVLLQAEAGSSGGSLNVNATATTTSTNCYHYDSSVQDPKLSKLQFDHPIIRQTLAYQHRLQASLSCSLTFAIVGFMKAGTTYVYDLISHHPQVVKNLKVSVRD